MWDKVLASLKNEVNEQVFNTWFSPIKGGQVEANRVVLVVPNKFFENWIRENYLSLIKSAVEKAAGRDLAVDFELAETAPAGKAQKKSETPSWFKSMFGGGKESAEGARQGLIFNSKYVFENFVVGSSNRFVHAAALAVCESPAKNYNPLFIYGGVGLGKTHLLQAIGHKMLSDKPKTKVLYISSEEFTNQLIQAIRTKTTQDFRDRYRNVDVLLMDDIQFIAGKESTQEEFFHTFNRLYDSHKQIIISSDRPPKEISALEERLISRFAWGLIADIQPPDFETRMAIMLKKCENEGVELGRDVLVFLAENIKTNIREMEGALIRVVAYSKLVGKELTVSLAKETLKGMILEEERKITIDSIQGIVAKYFGISPDDIKSKRRSSAVAYPRQVAMYLARSLTDHSLPHIGERFGGRDHTTVLYAFKKITREIKDGKDAGAIVENLTDRIKR